MCTGLNSPVSDVQAENFYFQVKFINCYLREIIVLLKNDIRDWGQSICDTAVNELKKLLGTVFDVTRYGCRRFNENIID